MSHCQVSAVGRLGRSQGSWDFVLLPGWCREGQLQALDRVMEKTPRCLSWWPPQKLG